ncbi:uncharacterized protein LOC100277188 [Zea mays]|jgi:hypothetical protein|uniref:Uncharacterized protein n=1 Tax=Zea mays TaxID=4577 RepID=C4IZI6_MAIZE|nr:uncharacterized protein LOC100277188 [Zea mays]ACR34336.1 unknown [Zea mays]ONM30370.1 hypothetical protein ZEAMMB73_Zm00001d040048 [Zea mays]|eukprot:NP_001144300.2 uncharacterized protein LOC100277188 [Zea mays]
MAASSSLSLPATPAALRHGACHGRPALPRRSPVATTTTRCAALRRDASGGRDQYGGALVDEGMSVLRRRIREARMAETNYEAPAEWAPWEKRYYPAYVSDVSSLVGALQLILMGTRPGVAVAVVALVLASVPVSAFAALHQLTLVVEAVLQSVSVHHIS